MGDLIAVEDHESYQDLLRANDAARAQARNNSRYKREYVKVLRAIKRLQNLDDGGNGELEGYTGEEEDEENNPAMVQDPVPLSMAEKRKKKALIIKGLRLYTDSGKDGKKYKGWSPDALTDYAVICDRMESNSKLPEVKRFREIYREICRRNDRVDKRDSVMGDKDDGIVPENIVVKIMGGDSDDDDEEEEEYFVEGAGGGSTTTGSSLTAEV